MYQPNPADRQIHQVSFREICAFLKEYQCYYPLADMPLCTYLSVRGTTSHKVAFQIILREEFPNESGWKINFPQNALISELYMRDRSITTSQTALPRENSYLRKELIKKLFARLETMGEGDRIICVQLPDYYSY
jgi:hypothetical protein